MRREITAAWETEEVRRERPSPLDEVRGALAVFEETIWDALPQYCRSLDRTLRQATGRGLPIGAAPIRFGSWIGGDRDGNPFVTPDVTRRACLMARWTALSLYAREIEQLRFELSMSDASPELLERVEGAHEPYRTILRALQQRLETSKQSVESLLRSPDRGTTYTGYAADTGYTWQPEQFETAADFAEPLLLCHRSLHDTGNGIIADGRLDRRAAAARCVRPHPRAARHPSGSRAPHRGRRRDHARPRARRVRLLVGSTPGRFPHQRAGAGSAPDAGAPPCQRAWPRCSTPSG